MLNVTDKPLSSHRQCDPAERSRGRVTMGRQSIWEYLRAVHARYRRADRPTKQKMLDVLCEHGLPPQACSAAAEWAAARSGAASAGPPGATTAHLRPGVGLGAEGDLEGGGLPLVGAAEGPDPPVDALGAEAFSSEHPGGAAVAGRQRARSTVDCGPTKYATSDECTAAPGRVAS